MIAPTRFFEGEAAFLASWHHRNSMEWNENHQQQAMTCPGMKFHLCLNSAEALPKHLFRET